MWITATALWMSVNNSRSFAREAAIERVRRLVAERLVRSFEVVKPDIAADAFTRFKTHGIFDREVGRAFWDAILAQGDSEEPIVLFERFMGRPPDAAALMRRAGLEAAAG